MPRRGARWLLDMRALRLFLEEVGFVRWVLCTLTDFFYFEMGGLDGLDWMGLDGAPGAC